MIDSNDIMNSDKENSNGQAKLTVAGRLSAWFSRMWAYVSGGVWRVTKSNWKVNVVKTLNLTVRSFFNSDLQSTACAMTYRTMLAIVPALALLFAIGRGFGFQNLLENQLYKLFPSQHQALQVAMRFIDSCLAQASEGVFVGIGLAFLLWTIISLLSSVEDAFNKIWNIPTGRSILRQVTDYTAICIILPVLMICAGGLQIMMSTTIQKLLPYHFMTPVMSVLFDVGSYVFTWLFFTGAYMMIPNTKVKFTNAFIAGVLAGTSFQLLQWAFASGQLYVAKYNAIYGTFSFLPLLLLWLQLSWLITLTGALVCYSSQNFFLFSFEHEINHVSLDYRRRVSLGVLTVIVQRFEQKLPPLTAGQISEMCGIPPRLMDIVVADLLAAGLITREFDSPEVQSHPLLPSMGLEHYTVSSVLELLRHSGSSDFVVDFDKRFGEVDSMMDNIDAAIADTGTSYLLKDIKLNIILSEK